MQLSAHTCRRCISDEYTFPKNAISTVHQPKSPRSNSCRNLELCCQHQCTPVGGLVEIIQILAVQNQSGNSQHGTATHDHPKNQSGLSSLTTPRLFFIHLEPYENDARTKARRLACTTAGSCSAAGWRWSSGAPAGVDLTLAPRHCCVPQGHFGCSLQAPACRC